MCGRKGSWVPKTDSKPANASSGKHTTDMDTLRDEMLAADLPICPAHFHSQLM
ncbi:hypothetical protein ALQ72_100534 [Pseudomonas syringae pv. maculicola]|uniref:Uncharacterized protein n=1 Tax=Pseudomonas syringae pv. spinaceae TaxID=264459 RepID=A0A0N8T5X0_PSESX|nr:Uncharacterized protein AC508_3436 [Pseudomonas amygdali pv. mellea]KPC21968.1 Uncharacterized protein AC498_0026 [Pseudomonas savastanoi pv. glycinea]KPY92368.1 hypothetical protein ALO94_100685 [Pseudomonas syringae pv. spinaceae]RMM82906.1 hypothetical protein ALQ72_100534 [Pseudomonas syringae pv. maculicola]RMQ50476.1 hypothetical protein ALQ02_101996 [Pseudomonas savastanoi pv. phaseolicola]RMS41035.1 hypothetical protein ALP67_101977 [Pseudomonas ficuserectae]GGJ51401.1 hypothetical